ncbi:hypothetical protein SAMN02745121_05702 [Nannocystis exedens]|uniref:Uncharacterized protein n=1 Tax=Nannocystis exedens TaxID=54 RepID=A0A1I2DQY1_9BACT|nr:hypothetical protein [Nannocystis exedens]PCC68966.1 hypothetical protein NAEX_01987 [Nannocystis exedens]SFE83012.1 hypothetical protein SAMN02745121_05702 [Nannocystis exedens]
MGPLVLALVAALPAQDVDVTWRGDPRCTQHGFQDSLARYLAGAHESRPVRVTVDVRRDGDGRWTATLDLEAAEGRSKRTLRGRSCAEIGDAAAFVTAVVVDPGVLTRPAEGSIVPAPDAAPADGSVPGDMSSETSAGDAAASAGDLTPGTGGSEAAVPVASDAAFVTAGSESAPPAEIEALGPASGAADEAVPSGLSEKPAKKSARPRGFVRVAGGLEALGMPRVGPAVGLAAGLVGRRWRVEVTGLYRAPTTAYTQIDPQAGARVRLWAVGARGCGVPRAGQVEFPLCGGLEAGQAIGAGVGFAGGRTDRIAWLALVFGPAVAWAPRPWLALWFGADVGVPLLGGTFSAAGLGRMFTIAPVSLRAALGLEFRFGRGGAG